MNNKKYIHFFIFSLLFSVSVFAQSTKSVVTSIKAESSSTKSITITWVAPEAKNSVSSLLIFRETKPFTNFSQIELLEPIAVLRANETSYTDIFVQSQDYFYAVVSTVNSNNITSNEFYYDEQKDLDNAHTKEDEIIKTVLPGVNATVKGVKATTQKKVKSKIKPQEKNKKSYENGELRETPLPFIDVLDEKTNHEPQISKESKKQAKKLIKKNYKQKPEPLPIHIFEEDLVSPAGGDEYLLFEILKNYFIKKQYSDSIKYLRKFLAQNRSKVVTDRASFYLGESYYYTGNFPSALTSFLTLEEVYPELSRQWIDSTLDQLN